MTGPATPEPTLDHIVILVPHSFLSAPPKWFADLFTFYPGGRHADGLTENTLVLLPDGSYLEFIAFVPGIGPAAREAHKWGRKREGTVIDWALTLPGSESGGPGAQRAVFDRIRGRVVGAAGTRGIGYGDLTAGGRSRPDGVVLKWATSGAYRGSDGGAAAEALEPGQLPFWCLDETPRGLRVPYLDPGVSEHPTGVVGVALVSITPDDDGDVESLDKVYGALLGEQDADSDSLWDLKTLAGETLHDGGQVRLEAVGAAPGISIAFFTNSERFAGTKVGGRVTEDVSLEFELVASS